MEWNIITDFWPGGELLRDLLIPLVAAALLSAGISGWLKVKMGARTPYSRKLFHFIIFSLAGIVQYNYGLKAVTLLGMIVFTMVMLTVLAGKQTWFYKALARETDAPYQARFIVLPLLATAIGGILSNIFFPATAFIGYFVGGWGDAIGEPVGTRWGRHRYTVPTLFGVRATRSIEGSLAVMIVSSLVATGCILQLVNLPFQMALLYGCIGGLAAALVEAASSHGLDNLTIQVCAAGVLHFLLF